MLLAFSMGAAAQPQITRKPKPKKEQAKPHNVQRNQKPAANQSQKPKPKVAYKNKTFTANGVSFNMVYVAGGTFQMGSNVGDYDEKPVHSVTLSDYYIGQTEVTQELWQAVMGSNPSHFEGAKKPVNDVSWNDCQEFISKLNRLTGGRFRLPTEAEWEYAARGGNKSRGYIFSGSNYLGSVAWYFDNSGGEVHPVGSKSPNELGLYDMSGNVWEWCSDRYGYYPSSSQTNPTGPSSGSNRVFRGGGWFSDAADCRVAIRVSDTPTNSKYILGLRLAH
ncbi:MAG: formylglycine-generating enzyme family protein [Alloprevotella sp.]|nr:formylglycine-generating enzyme family protein [Alloprevotella sp.]